jgi:hypothetical protein
LEAFMLLLNCGCASYADIVPGIPEFSGLRSAANTPDPILAFRFCLFLVCIPIWCQNPERIVCRFRVRSKPFNYVLTMTDFPKGGDIAATRAWLDKKGFERVFINWEADAILGHDIKFIKSKFPDDSAGQEAADRLWGYINTARQTIGNCWCMLLSFECHVFHLCCQLIL